MAAANRAPFDKFINTSDLKTDRRDRLTGTAYFLNSMATIGLERRTPTSSVRRR